MNNIKNLRWPLILALGVLALARPGVRIVGDQLGFTFTPAVPIILTLTISIIWIVVVGLSRISEPVLTLVFTGLLYAVLSIVLSGLLSPLLLGELRGPLASPIAIIPVLLINAIWGLGSGVLALLLQRLRGPRPHDSDVVREELHGAR